MSSDGYQTRPSGLIEPGGAPLASDTFRAPTNPSERARMSRAEMVELMRERFGEPPRWAFCCPRCGLVQSVAELSPFGVVVEAELGKMCASIPRRDGTCMWTAYTSAGGPLSVIIRTDTGEHLIPSMMVAPAGAVAGTHLDVGARP